MLAITSSTKRLINRAGDKQTDRQDSSHPCWPAGRPMMVAEVYLDDSMMLRAQSAAEWLAENDL